MSYMIEGGGSKNFSKCKGWLYEHPDAALTLLGMVERASIDYLVGQVRAGAQMLQVFESWAGELSPEARGGRPPQPAARLTPRRCRPLLSSPCRSSRA